MTNLQGNSISSTFKIKMESNSFSPSPLLLPKSKSCAILYVDYCNRLLSLCFTDRLLPLPSLTVSVLITKWWIPPTVSHHTESQALTIASKALVISLLQPVQLHFLSSNSVALFSLFFFFVKPVTLTTGLLHLLSPLTGMSYFSLSLNSIVTW